MSDQDPQPLQSRVVLDGPAPLFSAIVVAGRLARRHQGAERNPSYLRVSHLVGGYPHHHFIEECETLDDSTLADQREPLVGPGSELKRVIIELLGDRQRQLRLLQKLPRIVHVAAHQRDSVEAAFEAGTDGLEVAPAPLLPGLAPDQSPNIMRIPVMRVVTRTAAT